MTNAKGIKKSKYSTDTDGSSSVDWDSERAGFFGHLSFVIRIQPVFRPRQSITIHTTRRTRRIGKASVFRPEQDRLLVRAFDFDAVCLHTRVFFERVVNDAAVEGIHRLQFNDVPPTPDFFSRVLRLLYQRLAGGGTVPADVHHH